MTKHNKPENTSFLPDFCSANVLFIVVLSAELLAIILSLALPLYTRDLLYNLAMNSLFVQWIALSCVGVLCILKRKLAAISEPVAAAISYALVILISFSITELAWWALYVYPKQFIMDQTQHLYFLLRSVGISAIVGAIVLRYLYVQHQWRKNIEITATSRYQALQSRIRPHFLFNCMNTIASLTRKAPTLAEESIEDLADLFRATLLEPDKLISISDEWKICRTYLRIEKHRLENRLQVEWNIDALPDDALVPPLCLQPLLENAIYHGIERLPNGGNILIKGQLDQERLIINFINPLPAEDVTDGHRGTKQTQDNIRQRLKTLFEDRGDLIIENTNGLYNVTLTLPYRRYENSDR